MKIVSKMLSLTVNGARPLDRQGGARPSGPAPLAFRERNLLRHPYLPSVLDWLTQKGSVRWTRTGPAQRAVPHPR
jgi:hypothetical protein